MILLPNLWIRKNMPIFFGIGAIIHKRWERQCVLYAVLNCSQLILFPYIYYCVILISNYILCRRSYFLAWFVYCSKTLCKCSGSTKTNFVFTPNFAWVATAWMHIVSRTGHILFYFESLLWPVLKYYHDNKHMFHWTILRPEYFFCTSFPPQKNFGAPQRLQKVGRSQKPF